MSMSTRALRAHQKLFKQNFFGQFSVQANLNVQCADLSLAMKRTLSRVGRPWNRHAYSRFTAVSLTEMDG